MSYNLYDIRNDQHSEFFLNLTWKGCASGVKLKYVNDYTERHCLFECKVESVLEGIFLTDSSALLEYKVQHVSKIFTRLKIKKGCGCTAAFFPKTINQTESPPCSIYDHVTCVKDHLVAFNQSARAKCNCQKDCVHSEPVAIHIQYGLE